MDLLGGMGVRALPLNHHVGLTFLHYLLLSRIYIPYTLFPLRIFICTMDRRLLSYTNLVVGNEDEFRALADRVGLLVSPECESIASVARKVAALEYIAPVNQFKSCRLSDFQGFPTVFIFNFFFYFCDDVGNIFIRRINRSVGLV